MGHLEKLGLFIHGSCQGKSKQAGLVVGADGDVRDLQQEEARREEVLSPSLRFGDAARSALAERIKELFSK